MENNDSPKSEKQPNDADDTNALTGLPVEPKGASPGSTTLPFGTMHQQMIEWYSPPSLLVGPDDQLIHYSQQAGRFLSQPLGENTGNVFQCIREEFHTALRAALQGVREKGISIHSDPVAVRIEGVLHNIILSVHPSLEPQQPQCLLLLFHQGIVPLTSEGKSSAATTTMPDPTLQALESELALSKQQLQSLKEEYEASKEQMNASHEALLTTCGELRSAVEVLEASNEELATLSGELQNLLKATDIATLMLDRQLQIMRFTPRISELFNVRAGDQGRPLSDITHRLGYHELPNDAQQVLEKLVPIEREVVDEEGRCFLTRMFPYPGGQDWVEGVVITFVDITGQKEVEVALREKEERLHVALHAAGAGVWTYDIEGGKQTWSSELFDIFGVMPTPERELPLGWVDTIPIQERDRVTGQVFDLFARQLPQWELEYQINHPLRGERWISTHGLITYDEAGQPIRIVGITMDITERKKIEAALQKAKVEAEQAAKAKEDFLAHMSHEIRTPLNAIVGLSALLLQRDPKKEQLENLHVLKFSAENLMVLINDILDFSKIQAGKVSIEETDLNLRALMNNLEKAHQFKVQENGIELLFQIDERLPAFVNTDALKLSQVLNNLISNALKFTFQGKVTIEVKLLRKEGDNLWVYFSVTDTGIGISEEKLSHIFDAFTQADNSTVRQFGGTGLGLTITKLLLDFMDSQIEVISKKGEGSCFYFTLPMKVSESNNTSFAKTEESLEDDKVLRHLKLLLVEDVDVNRMVMRQFLLKWWHLIPDEAINGRQALEMAQQKQYDLILMDIRMPEMDGYQAAKAIRAIKGKKYGQVPILALTADTVNEVMKHIEASLFTDVITKPVDPNNLRQKLILHTAKQHPPLEIKKTFYHQGDNRSDGTAVPLDLQTISQLFQHDHGKVQKFLGKAMRDMISLLENYNTSMANRDEKLMENVLHKSNVLLNTLALKDVKWLLEHSESLIKAKAPQIQMEAAAYTLKVRIEEVLVTLKDHIAKLDHP